MVTFISSIGDCISRLTSGKRVGQKFDNAVVTADHPAIGHKEGFAWGHMAVLTRDLCARTLVQRKLPVENRISPGHFDPTSNKIKVMTMKVSKGLEFPVVALPGVGHMPSAGKDEKEAARVCYVAATEVTNRLLIRANGTGTLSIAFPNIQST